MKQPRQPAREVELEDIIADGILDTDGEALGIALKIHLALEALIIEMIRTKQSNNDFLRWNFPTKTEYLQKEGILTDPEKQAFDLVNDMRNDMAHVFGHRLTTAEALLLAGELEDRGIDFSDSMGRYPEAVAIENYGGLEGILVEIGWCVLFHAAYLLESIGGRDIFTTRPNPN